MVSPLSLLHGLLPENTHVVSAVPAATLAAQLTGRNREHLCAHDVSSKMTCLDKSQPSQEHAITYGKGSLC